MFRPKSTLEQWRIFQAVVEHGGYAQAAEKLNKSQSSLNHAIAKLQQTLGVALLEVRGRKAYLTDAGDMFLRRAKSLNQQMQELELLAHNIHQGWEAEIRFAIELAHPRRPLNRALQNYYPVSRGTHLQLFDSVLWGTTEIILEQKADIVISGQVPKGFLGEPLAEVTLWPVCHPQHPLALEQGILSPDELSQQLQIVIRDTAKNPKELTGWLKAEQRWTVTNFHEAIEILLTGMGFAWLPQHLVEGFIQRQQLHRISLREGNERKFFTQLIVPAPERLGPSANCLLECLRLSHPLTASYWLNNKKTTTVELSPPTTMS
ncbi:LysR family transcriptional regulator [Tolumonas lignilytica]|uniref:LysR family transcriptional regulator n=1 Tax=Tolumonas lignilytica TaxID=1283284 RepID=UPI0004638EF3|nr:LysR family transcriptional regulator [Tolumonas lignilytica]